MRGGRSPRIGEPVFPSLSVLRPQPGSRTESATKKSTKYLFRCHMTVSKGRRSAWRIFEATRCHTACATDPLARVQRQAARPMWKALRFASRDWEPFVQLVELSSRRTSTPRMRLPLSLQNTFEESKNAKLTSSQISTVRWQLRLVPRIPIPTPNGKLPPSLLASAKF